MKRLIRLQLLGFHSGKQPGREDPLTLMAQSIPSSLTFSTDQHPILFPFMLNLFIHFIFSISLKDVHLASSSVCYSIPMFLPSLCPEADLYGAASVGLTRPMVSDWVGPLWGTDRKSEGWRREARKRISPLPYLLAKPQFPLSTRQHQSGSPSPKAILLSGFQEQCPPLAPLILGW